MTTTTRTAPLQAAAPPVAAFDTEVLAVERLSPAFQRFVLGGDDLADLADLGPLGPRDLRIKIVVGGRDPQRTWVFDDGWYPRWLALPEADRGWMRTYTVRAVLPGPRMVLDVVRHEGGPAARWAASARVGDRLTVLGPRGDLAAYRGVEWAPPPPPASLLLVGDETAVPAVASILATLPAGYRAHAVLEVPSADDVLDVASPGGAVVTWAPRGGRAPGAALRPLVAPIALGVFGGAPARHAWLAGESAVVRDLRRCLLREVGLRREELTFMGYWRAG